MSHGSSQNVIPIRASASKATMKPYENRLPAKATDDEPLADEIEFAIAYAKIFVKLVVNTECRYCGNLLPVDAPSIFRGWQRKGGVISMSGLICDCGATTCVGCKHKPRTGDTRYMGTYGGRDFEWCCNNGRVFAVWVLLCRYDMLELSLQARSSHSEASRSRPPREIPSTGTGYGSMYMSPFQYVAGHSAFDPAEGFNREVSQALNFRQSDADTDSLTQLVFGMMVEMLPVPGKDDKSVPPALASMIELSLLQDRAAQLLRNDSLENVDSRAYLYFATFEFVHRLAAHERLDYLALEPRFSKKRSAGLLAITSPAKGNGKQPKVEQSLALANRADGMTPSLVSCMANLAKQSRVLLENTQAKAAGRDIIEVARCIDELYTALAPKKATLQIVETWKTFHENSCVMRKENVARCLDEKMRDLAMTIQSSNKHRMRRLVTETSEMTTSLPEGIFVIVDEVRPDIMKAMIVGPEGTPYEGGLFEFDIVCPKDYPFYPPAVWFRTTGQGTVAFNPNLYNTGKVCLSLINTWVGGPETKWQPGKSTITSILVSIQAMIFWEHPRENEPGCEDMHLSEYQGERLKCYQYNQQLQSYTVRYAILDWMAISGMRNGIWKELIQKYFAFNGKKLVEKVKEWEKENPCFQRRPGQGWLGLPVRKTRSIGEEMEYFMGRCE